MKKRQELSMSRNDSGSFLTFLMGIGVGAAAVILLGSKRVDQLHEEVTELLNDGLDQVQNKTKDMRQAEKTVNTAQQKVQEAINAGADAYSEAKRS
jgi:hypothetical protein